jgi:hypothetical protein
MSRLCLLDQRSALGTSIDRRQQPLPHPKRRLREGAGVVDPRRAVGVDVIQRAADLGEFLESPVPGLDRRGIGADKCGYYMRVLTSTLKLS